MIIYVKSAFLHQCNGRKRRNNIHRKKVVDNPQNGVEGGGGWGESIKVFVSTVDDVEKAGGQTGRRDRTKKGTCH